MQKPETVPVIPENIPAMIKALDRWVLWKWTYRKGKWAKPPRQVDGSFARSDDSRTWATYEAAIQAYRVGDFDGIGIVLPDGITGVDSDDSVLDGHLNQDARLLMAMLPTYCERSPSGSGIKFLASGKLNAKLAKTNHARGLELYDGGDTARYFTITGNVMGDHKEITEQRESLFTLQGMITESVQERTQVVDSAEDAERAVRYLQALRAERADAYDEWIRIGMALSSVDKSDEMLDHWVRWSEQSDKFAGEDECRAKWDSFRREEGRLATLAVLERAAREDGYKERKFSAEFVTAASLAAKEIVQEFVVENLMVLGEPMIIGGAAKSLKTTISLDLALSISTGTPFLGNDQYQVSKARRVAFISGESGETTLQRNLLAMTSSRGLDPRSLTDLLMGFRLPKLDDPDQVDDLIEQLIEADTHIAIIDPLYRSLRVGDSASNVYSMGERLEFIAEKIHRANITPILCHHFRKQGKSYGEAPELEDLSQSGVAEFGRQFILLKKCKEYLQDSHHTMWLSYGGSAGHQGLRIIEAFTGDHKQAAWNVSVMSVDEYQAREEESKQVEKEQKMDDLRGRLLEVIEADPGLTSSDLVERMGVRRTSVTKLLSQLSKQMEAHFVVGEKGSKRWFRNLGEESKQAEKEQKIDDLRGRLLEVMGANPGRTTNDLVSKMGAAKATVIELLGQLEEQMEAHFKPGPRGAKLWFRNLDEDEKRGAEPWF